jgi:DNA-binding NtrC family response regulator
MYLYLIYVRRFAAFSVIHHGVTVLILEDDALTRSSLGRVLAGRGFHVLGAANGREALEVCVRHSQPIDLLLCDLVLPDTDGLTVAAKIQALRPQIKIVFMSGFSEGETVCEEAEARGIEILEKPFTNADLTLKIQAAMTV